jgi:hypothetical protein
MKRRISCFVVLLAAVVEIPTAAHATVYDIHVGGVCGTLYINGPGAASDVGHWADEVSVSAPVDQRDSMANAVSDMRSVFDTYCSDPDSCNVYAYSNGAAVVSKTLSTFSDAGWNVDLVLQSGGSEGGSEVAGTGWVGEAFGGCALAGSADLTPTAHRSNWNHDDTAGALVYGLAGTGHTWWSFLMTLLIPGKNDSVVGFHSAGGMNSVGAYYDACAGPKYNSHFVESTLCHGVSNHHWEISRGYVCLRGGC